jgi:diguanylate cyclase (GGDEF)-like protein
MTVNKFEKYKDILFSTLAEISSLIASGNDKNLIFEKVLDCCLAVIESERVYLLELDDGCIIRYSKSKDSTAEEGINIESLPESPVIREWVMKEGSRIGQYEPGGELAVDLPSLATAYLEDQSSNQSIMSAPLVAKKSMFGLLVAIQPGYGAIHAPDDVKLMTVLANQAAIALENQKLYRKLEFEAVTDGLTGVYNYRFLVDALATEIKRARRFSQVFSFVMLDVDNLKSYNDRLGHLQGSEALKRIAHIIVENCREIDLVCKYGGDEFGILLPQTDLVGAETVTRRVIEAVAETVFGGEQAGVITCSAGISEFPDDGETGRELISSADKALYRAKRDGKNRLLTTWDLVSDSKR